MLRDYLATHPSSQFDIWTDRQIELGAKWFDQIKDAMKDCDTGLLLVSPSFLASQFIKDHGLKYRLENKHVISIGLRPILFDGSMNLHGLEERQIFFDGGGKAWSERSKGNPPRDLRARAVPAHVRDRHRPASAQAQLRSPPPRPNRRIQREGVRPHRRL